MTVTISGTNGVTTPEITVDNTAADGGQVVLKSSGYSDWNWDNYSGRLRAYYGGTEYFTINSSGNVGIGTSSPSGPLGIYRGASTAALVEIAGNANTPGTSSLAVGQDTTGNAYVYQRANLNLIFGTNSAERMRIDSSGNLLVGTTSGSATRLSVVPTVGNAGVKVTQAGAGDYCYQALAANNGGNYYFHYFVAGSTYVGQITSNGVITSYTSASDYRLKENIQPMQNALDVVAQLNPVTYTWKADGSDGQGFIAHELQAVVPDCVTGEKDAVDAEGNPVYQGIDTSFLVATLTKAIQEQQEQIEQLKSEVAALKGVAQ